MPQTIKVSPHFGVSVPYFHGGYSEGHFEVRAMSGRGSTVSERYLPTTNENPLKRCFKGFCLILSSKLLDLERKTRLELVLKIQISHSFSASCSNNLHQTNKRLRYQSQIYKKSQNTPKTIQNYHKKSTSILKTSQINYCKLYHKLTNHVRYRLCLIYMDY